MALFSIRQSRHLATGVLEYWSLGVLEGAKHKDFKVIHLSITPLLHYSITPSGWPEEGKTFQATHGYR
jgi:hypothetical protein